MGLIYSYDGSLEGFMTVIAKAVKSREEVIDIFPANRRASVPSLLDREVFIESSPEQAGRLHDFVVRRLSRASGINILRAYLSELPGAEKAVAEYIRLGIKHRRKLDQHLTAEPVRDIHNISRKFGTETARLAGLLRFREIRGNILYAPFESNHNVIWSLSGHFRSRMGAERWILHDIGRDSAVLHSGGGKLVSVDIDREISGHVDENGGPPPEWLADDEWDFQELWRSFHRHIAIPNKINAKLQRQFMPRRYWKFLIEAVGGL